MLTHLMTHRSNDYVLNFTFEGHPETTYKGEYSRDDLLSLQTFVNKKFTAKGAPTRAFMRELVYNDNFEWDNGAWDRKWNAMSDEERREWLQA